MTGKANKFFPNSRKKRHVHHSALNDSRFRRYYPASWFSGLGSWLLRFLLGWSAWELTHSATWVGIIGFLMLAPALVLSPWFGILSDRVNPRHGLRISMLIHCSIALTGALSTQLGIYNQSTLIFLATALGVVTSLHSPMRLALVPLLVEREALPSAVGYAAMSFNIARILGPALGAILVAQGDARLPWLVSMVMFGVSFWVLSRLVEVAERPPPTQLSFIEQLIEGLRYLSDRAGLKLLLALTALNGLMGRTVIELLPAVSGQILQGGSSELAALVAMGGLGSVVGGLLVSRQSADVGSLLLMVCGSIGLACLILISLRWFPNLMALSIWVSSLSIVTTVAGVGCQTLVQLTAEEVFRGRVMSIWTMVAMGAPALGAAILGAGADEFGFNLTLTMTGLFGVVAVLGIYARGALTLLVEPP